MAVRKAPPPGMEEGQGAGEDVPMLDMECVVGAEKSGEGEGGVAGGVRGADAALMRRLLGICWSNLEDPLAQTVRQVRPHHSPVRGRARQHPQDCIRMPLHSRRIAHFATSSLPEPLQVVRLVCYGDSGLRLQVQALFQTLIEVHTLEGAEGAALLEAVTADLLRMPGRRKGKYLPLALLVPHIGEC
eukprot:8336059-Pyramimonas_sp.AAC.1